MRSVDAGYDMLRSIDGFQLEELAGESVCADMAHSVGVLYLYGSRNSCQSDTVWKLIGRNEGDESSVASRDEVTEARRLGGYSGRWW